MDYIHYALSVLIVLFIYIAITKFYMLVANYIGEHLGFGKFFMYLWRKIRRKSGEQDD